MKLRNEPVRYHTELGLLPVQSEKLPKPSEESWVPMELAQPADNAVVMVHVNVGHHMDSSRVIRNVRVYARFVGGVWGFSGMYARRIRSAPTKWRPVTEAEMDRLRFTPSHNPTVNTWWSTLK